MMDFILELPNYEGGVPVPGMYRGTGTFVVLLLEYAKKLKLKKKKKSQSL